jgi:hypothetical protein
VLRSSQVGWATLLAISLTSRSRRDVTVATATSRIIVPLRRGPRTDDTQLFLLRGGLGFRFGCRVLVTSALTHFLGQLARVKRRSWLSLEPLVFVSDFVHSLVRLAGADALSACHR